MPAGFFSRATYLETPLYAKIRLFRISFVKEGFGMARRKLIFALSLCLVALASACGGEIKPEVDDNQAQANAAADAQIGEIIITNRDARQMVESDTITLPNCGGSKTLEIRRTLSKEMPRTVQLTKTEQPIPVSDGVVIEAVRALFKAEPDEVVAGTADVTLESEPGMTTTYPVTWSAAGVVGVVEARVDDKPYFQEFWLPAELVAELGAPEARPCDAG